MPRRLAKGAGWSCSGQEYLNDAELSDEQRAKLREFTVPRRALDGRIVWPIDELVLDASPGRGYG